MNIAETIYRTDEDIIEVLKERGALKFIEAQKERVKGFYIATNSDSNCPFFAISIRVEEEEKDEFSLDIINVCFPIEKFNEFSRWLQGIPKNEIDLPASTIDIFYNGPGVLIEREII